MAEEQNNAVVSKQQKQEVANAITNSTIADSILSSFNKLATQGQLVFPKGYNVGNQLKLMYTSLSQNNQIAKATTVSIGEALTEAVVQGLEIDKKQCYFIVYDRKMVMFRSYYGDVVAAKRTGLVKDIRARVIYKDDVYDIDTDEYGESIIVGHKTKLENMDKDIVGAYAWADCVDGRRLYCIMTWKEIQTNWSKSKNTSGNVQKEFPQEMSKRTVIRRLVKTIFNTAPADISDEAKAIIGSYTRTTEQEYNNDNQEKPRSATKTTVKNVVIDDESGEIVEDKPQMEPKEEIIDVDVETPSEEIGD